VQASGHDAQAWAKYINDDPTRGFLRGQWTIFNSPWGMSQSDG